MDEDVIHLLEFDHVTIIVAEVQRTREFFVDILGMAEVDRPDFSFPGAWFQLGTMQIHATLASPEAGIAGLGDLNASSLARGHHIAFAVDSVDDAIAHLAQYQLEPVAGPRQRPDGITQVYFQDPDGHVIEFFQR